MVRKLRWLSASDVLFEAIKTDNVVLFDALVYVHKQAQKEWALRNKKLRRFWPKPYALELDLTKRTVFRDAVLFGQFQDGRKVGPRIIEEAELQLREQSEDEQVSFWDDRISQIYTFAKNSGLEALSRVAVIRSHLMSEIADVAMVRGEFELLATWCDQGIKFNVGNLTIPSSVKEPRTLAVLQNMFKKELHRLYLVDRQNGFESFVADIVNKQHFKFFLLLANDIFEGISAAKILRTFGSTNEGSNDPRVILYLINEAASSPHYEEVKRYLLEASPTFDSPALKDYVKKNRNRTDLSLSEFLLISSYDQKQAPLFSPKQILDKNPHLVQNFLPDLYWFSLLMRTPLVSLQVVLEQNFLPGSHQELLSFLKQTKVFNPEFATTMLARARHRGIEY